MRACLTSCGLDITLLLSDKEIGEKEGKLECKMIGRESIKVRLFIVNNINKRYPEEESGFHIIGIPHLGGRDKRKRYEIYLSKERFKKLTNPEGDPIVEGGYFSSRSFYDRIDFKYYAI